MSKKARDRKKWYRMFRSQAKDAGKRIVEFLFRPNPFLDRLRESEELLKAMDDEPWNGFDIEEPIHYDETVG